MARREGKGRREGDEESFSRRRDRKDRAEGEGRRKGVARREGDGRREIEEESFSMRRENVTRQDGEQLVYNEQTFHQRCIKFPNLFKS